MTLGVLNFTYPVITDILIILLSFWINFFFHLQHLCFYAKRTKRFHSIKAKNWISWGLPWVTGAKISRGLTSWSASLNTVGAWCERNKSYLKACSIMLCNSLGPKQPLMLVQPRKPEEPWPWLVKNSVTPLDYAAGSLGSGNGSHLGTCGSGGHVFKKTSWQNAELRLGVFVLYWEFADVWLWSKRKDATCESYTTLYATRGGGEGTTTCPVSHTHWR